MSDLLFILLLICNLLLIIVYYKIIYPQEGLARQYFIFYCFMYLIIQFEHYVFIILMAQIWNSSLMYYILAFGLKRFLKH